MKSKLLLIVLAITIFNSYTSRAQRNIDVSFHTGVVMPNAEFASDDLKADNSGGAATGIVAGFNLNYPLSESGFGAFLGFDVTYNPLQQAVKDTIMQEYTDLSSDDFKWEKYINVPINGGLSYIYNDNGKVAVFGNVGGVINFLKITNHIIQLYGQEQITSFDSQTGYGYKVGAGLVFDDKWMLSIDYYDLGEYNFESNYTGPSGIGKEPETRTISFINFTLGLIIE